MIEISLCARPQSSARDMAPAERLEQIQEFFRQHRGPDIVRWNLDAGMDGTTVFSPTLHPAAPPAKFSVSEDGRVWASAATLPAGPGYHADFCGVLQQLGDELELTWDEPDTALGTGDPTGYFQTGKFGRVQHTMIAQLRQRLTFHLKGDPQKFGRAPIFLPQSWIPVGEGLLYSLVGPRTVEWANAVVGGDNVRALNIFPWQRPERDSNYWLGRAITEMWCNVRWRRPVLDHERERQQAALHALETAHRLDPEAPTYWHEWKELRGFLGMASPPPADPALDTRHPSQIPAGYWRNDITFFPGGIANWHFNLPGALAIEDSNERFRAFDSLRQVTFEAFVRKGDTDLTELLMSQLEAEVAEGAEPLEEFTHATPQVSRAGVVYKLDKPDPFPYRLTGLLGTERDLARFTVDYAEGSLRDWAMAAWQTIRFATVKRGSAKE